MSEVNNGWRQCPLGELDRLESMLKGQRHHKTWGYTLAVFALAGIIAFCSWQVASGLIPSLKGGPSHGTSNCSPFKQPFYERPCDAQDPGKGSSTSSVPQVQ
jgi:hypothetical protein